MIALIIFPFLTAIVYLIARGGGMAERQGRDFEQAKEEPGCLHQVGRRRGTSPANEIAQAKQLLDSGAISQQEFDSIKSKALSS